MTIWKASAWTLMRAIIPIGDTGTIRRTIGIGTAIVAEIELGKGVALVGITRSPPILAGKQGLEEDTAVSLQT
jgi:hypothetical protein